MCGEFDRPGSAALKELTVDSCRLETIVAAMRHDILTVCGSQHANRGLSLARVVRLPTVIDGHR